MHIAHIVKTSAVAVNKIKVGFSLVTNSEMIDGPLLTRDTREDLSVPCHIAHACVCT
jgi:hypothetical protein